MEEIKWNPDERREDKRKKTETRAKLDGWTLALGAVVTGLRTPVGLLKCFCECLCRASRRDECVKWGLSKEDPHSM